MRYLGVWFLRPWALGSRQSFTSGEKVACEAFQGFHIHLKSLCANASIPDLHGFASKQTTPRHPKHGTFVERAAQL